ncbi:hypothetical protein GCM10009562_32120 [Nocardioides aquaticus]
MGAGEQSVPAQHDHAAPGAAVEQGRGGVDGGETAADQHDRGVVGQGVESRGVPGAGKVPGRLGQGPVGPGEGARRQVAVGQDDAVGARRALRPTYVVARTHRRRQHVGDVLGADRQPAVVGPGEKVVQVGRVRRAGQEPQRVHGPPGRERPLHEVPGVVGEGAHVAAAHVQQVPLVGRGVRHPARDGRAALVQHDAQVAAARGVQQVDGGERAARPAPDDRDRGHPGLLRSVPDKYY